MPTALDRWQHVLCPVLPWHTGRVGGCLLAAPSPLLSTPCQSSLLWLEQQRSSSLDMQQQLEAACERELGGGQGTDSSSGGAQCAMSMGITAEHGTSYADPVQCLVARMVAPLTGPLVDGRPYSSEGLGDTCRTAVAGVLRRRQANWRLDPVLEAACR